MIAPEPELGRSTMVIRGASLLVVGVLCFIVGAALAWGSNPLVGFSIGGAGTIAIVIGSILVRNAMIGRFLEGGEE